jgi:hypothetical protein
MLPLDENNWSQPISHFFFFALLLRGHSDGFEGAIVHALFLTDLLFSNSTAEQLVHFFFGIDFAASNESVLQSGNLPVEMKSENLSRSAYSDNEIVDVDED